MANYTRVHTETKMNVYPLISGKERLSRLEGIRGMWRHRKAYVEQTLRALKRERERPLPHR